MWTKTPEYDGEHSEKTREKETKRLKGGSMPRPTVSTLSVFGPRPQPHVSVVIWRQAQCAKQQDE